MTTSISYQTPPTGPDAPTEELNKTQGNVPVVKEGEQPKPGDRPAWLPENFDTPEAFAKSFTDQRAELTRAQQELAKLKGGEEKKDGEQKPEDKTEETDEQKAARETLEKSGVDNAPFQSEFDETGDLSEESRAKAAEAYKDFIAKTMGKDADARQIVDQWIDGQKAVVNNYRAEVFKHSGGEEQYSQMTTWAKTNLNTAEQAAFNKAVNSGDLNAARMAVDGLSNRFTKATGNQPNLLGGDGHSVSAAGFASSHEMQKAISDPRYEVDPVYRKSVEQRIGRSNF